MRLILYVYKISGKFTVDVFLKGHIIDKGELIHDIEDILFQENLKGVRRVIYVDRKFGRSLRSGDKLMTAKKVCTMLDASNSMIETNETMIPNRYKRLIKKLAEDSNEPSLKIHSVPTPPDSPRMSDIEFDGPENQPKKQDSSIVLKHLENVYDLTLESQNQISGGLTTEMLNNINMLKEIGFIPQTGYKIHGDKVILEKPVGCSYGDYIINRQGSSLYKRDGYQQRINRLSYLDID